MNEQLVEEIVNREWEMFDAVNSIGGRSSCQDDPETFRLMRTGQAETWPEELLLSYLDDLKQAKAEGRNLMTEKYARMMESTAPHEYEAMASLLPPVDDETLDLIEKIISVFLEWRSDTFERYAFLSFQSRPIYTTEDSVFQTSFETYLRGELKTYSPKTVQLYYEMTLEYQNAKKNLEEITLLSIVKKYGYQSLAQADDGAFKQLCRQQGGCQCQL